MKPPGRTTQDTLVNQPGAPVAPGKRRASGTRHEALASEFLTSQGLISIETNFSCRLGEIDLIMRDGDTLVFVEVRSRTRTDFMAPVTSVDYRKQQKLLRSAAVYLKYHGLTDKVPCRIDVVGIHRSSHADEYQFDWIRNAIEQRY